MKFKLFVAAAFLLGLLAGCVPEKFNSLSEIKLSQTYASIPQGGGSAVLEYTATDNWQVDLTGVDWLSANPSQGNAGEGQITFYASETSETRQADFKIVCAGKNQLIRIVQQAEVGEPEIITCKQAVDLIKADAQGTKTYYVKGIVCSLYDISVQYGNATFWMSDNGVYNETDGQNLYVYRSTWLNGGKITTGDEIAIGDEIVVSGCLTNYNGTPETLQNTTTVVSITKSLIKCDSLVVNGVKCEELPIEGGVIDAVLMCKGNGIKVVVPDEAKSWLSVTGVNTGDGVATVSFLAANNAGGDRSAEITFTTSDGTKDYNAKATIKQKGAILEVSIAEFNAAPVDDTQYRISGIITTLEQDTDRYGANLYIKDATGETYIYGTTDATGTVKTLASFGAKEGDIVEFVGKRAEHNGNPQIAKAVYQWHKTVTPVTAAEAAALADDDTNDPQNYVKITGTVTNGSAVSGHKFDLVNYGNFDLVDETGSIYVYGVSTGWKGAKGNGAFATLGVKEGDKITIIAYKTSYNGMSQLVGYYYSHESGETPEPPAPTGENVVLTFPDDNSDNNKVGSYDGTWTAKAGAQEFTIANFNNNNWGSNWTFIKCGRKADESTASITTTIADKISKVTVNFDNIKAEDVTSATLYVGETPVTAAELKAGDVDFVVANPAENQTYKLEFVCKVSSESKNGFVVIKKIEYIVAE